MKTAGIPSPAGFKAGGIHCGIKKRSKDLAIIYSEVPAVCAGMFTTNQVQAEPVKLTKKVVSQGVLQAIVANSGNANALTGPAGERDTLEMARTAAGALEIDVSKVAVASTGPIGKPLPIKPVVEGIEKLAKKIDSISFIDAAHAILTTDTHPKFISKEVHGGTITAIAKGAGMIFPHMATMLCFITTDLKIPQPALYEFLKNSVEESFNCISIDGCMSTNDMVLAMANGMAENPSNELDRVQDALKEITKKLARMIVSDGEGATKLIELEVSGAPSFNDARAAAFSIANYNLLKCSFFGESLNTGRLMAAIGASPVKISPENVNIQSGNNLKQKNINIKINLNAGSHKATIWTTDLSPRYVKINME